MALTKQQQNKRSQKQSKKAQARARKSTANNRYDQMIADRKAQSHRGSIDVEAFNTAAMGVLNRLELMECPDHKTGIALVVRGDGYSGASTLAAHWNDNHFTDLAKNLAKNTGQTEAQTVANLMAMVDLGEMNFRDYNDLDTPMESETKLLHQDVDQTSPEVRLLKAVTLFANIAHNAAGKNDSMTGEASQIRGATGAAIHRLIRQIDPTARKVAIAMSSMPASPGVIRDMGSVLKQHEMVFMDMNSETDSIIIQNEANETLACVSLYHWAHSNAPLLMTAMGSKESVPEGVTIH